MSNAEREDITLGDGVKPTERATDDIMALLDDVTICFVGFIGHMCFNSSYDKVIRVDYENYTDGSKDYLILDKK